MSEVEAGTANSGARFYAEMVRRNEEHARRTGGICPSPARCPGTPLITHKVKQQLPKNRQRTG